MRLMILEVYEGVVIEVTEDTVTVVYEVEGGPVEQTYVNKQFIAKPRLGSRLRITTKVEELENEGL